jgi:RNA polymerase sigma factor (sigma-70 family)
MWLSDVPRISRRGRRYTKRRNRLVERHLFLVAALAQRLKRALPAWIELDELKADGAVGLVYAAVRFDRRRGVPFARFATRYIRGAMIDGVRRRGRGLLPLSDCDVAMLDVRFDRIDARADARTLLSLQPDARRRLVLLLYYFDGLTMKRIGRVLGISEGRVSQLVKRSVESVRQSVSPQPEAACFSPSTRGKIAPLRVAAKRRRAA